MPNLNKEVKGGNSDEIGITVRCHFIRRPYNNLHIYFDICIFSKVSPYLRFWVHTPPAWIRLRRIQRHPILRSLSISKFQCVIKTLKTKVEVKRNSEWSLITEPFTWEEWSVLDSISDSGLLRVGYFAIGKAHTRVAYLHCYQFKKKYFGGKSKKVKQ